MTHSKLFTRLCAALLLLAFVLMTLSMGALWYAGLLNFHRGELQEGFMRHTALLYWDQPLLYFTLLEQFAPRYLTHELAGKTEAARRVALGRQIQTLQQGGLLREPIAASSD